VDYSIPFDTHAYVKQLAAVPKAQAEVHAQAIAKLVSEQLAMKRDLRELELRLRHDPRLGAVAAAAIVIVAPLVRLV
jgi:hypothetical protein